MKTLFGEALKADTISSDSSPYGPRGIESRIGIVKRPSRRLETSTKRVRKRGLATDARRLPRWRFYIAKQVVPLTVSTIFRREISSRCFCHPLSFACLPLALPDCRVACLMCQNGDQLMAMLTLWMDGTLHFREYVISLQNGKKRIHSFTAVYSFEKFRYICL